MVEENDLKDERIKQQKRFKDLTPEIQKIWKSISDNYWLIEGAQLSKFYNTSYDTKQSRRSSSNII